MSIARRPCRTAAFCLAFVLAAAVSGGLLSQAHAAAAEEVSTLLYSRPMGAKGQLGTFLQSGGETQLVSYIQGAHVAARLSPDGRSVLFHSTQGGTLGVWLAGADGANARRLCDGSAAEWSRDGRGIIFVRGGRVLRRDIASGTEDIISPPALTACRFASHGADGSLLIVDTAGQKDSLYIFDRATGALKVLAKGDIDSTPMCSPDGTLVAYQDGAHIFTVGVDTGVVRQVTLAAGVQAWPAWSRDGRTVYYSQRAAPGDAICEIHCVDIDRPGTVGVVLTGANPSFDWNGVAAAPEETKTVKGVTLDVMHGAKDLDIRDFDGWKTAARPVPAGQSDAIVQGTLAVENDWFTLAASAGGVISIFPKEEDGFGAPIEIRPLRVEGLQVRSMRLETRDSDEILLAVELAASPGPSGEVLLQVRRTTPVVGISSGEAFALAIWPTGTAAVIIPDRYSNDIVLDWAVLPSFPRAALPAGPVAVACTEGGGALLVSGGDGWEAVVSVWKSVGYGGTQLAVRLGARLELAVLPRPFWYRAEPKQDDETWSVDSEPPLSARWRLASAEGRPGSMMWDGAEELEKPGPAPAACIAYMWGRAADTPLDVRTLEDAVSDAFGTRKGALLLDQDGVRGWRSAREPVAMQQIFLRPHGWDPTLIHTVPGDLGILEAMMGIWCADEEPVRALVSHFGRDILLLLEGLDDRITEYRAFLAALEGLCSGDDAQGDAFLADVASRLEKLNADIADAGPGELADVHNSLDAVINEALKARGYLHERQEYQDFSAATRAALAERLRVVEPCRRFAKLIRDDAALEILGNPDAPASCEKVREMTRGILRNRYYLEGDWRGEQPAEGGAK